MKKIALQLVKFSRFQKLFLVLVVDLLTMILVWIVFGPPLSTAMSSGFESSLLKIISNDFSQIVLPIGITIIFLNISRFYKTVIRFYDPIDNIFNVVFGSLIFGFSWLLVYLSNLPAISSEYLLIFILQALMLSVVLFSFITLSRIMGKYILLSLKSSFSNAEPIIIYGAGSAGKEVFEALQFDNSKKIIGFFDDSSELSNRLINNVPIFSSYKKLSKLKQDNPNLTVLLAIPSLDLQSRRTLISKLEEIKIAVRTVPAFHELVFDSKKMSDIQNLSIDDILPNRRIDDLKIDNSNERTYLVSGGGGSIGSEIVRQLLIANVKEIIIFDNSEFNLFKIFEESKILKENKNLKTKLIPILGDVRDTNLLKRTFKARTVDVVYHAAAYKHVPLIENDENICSAVSNNFLGTYNFALEAIRFNVKTFVLVSTDKAVRPTNIMGATKRLAELAVQNLNESSKSTKLCMVRFGNVINSSGSVIPTFMQQIASGGPITITHKDVMRYFMTIPEASNLVIQASELSEGGEVFILDMGSQMKIMDIAKRLIHLSGRNIALSENDDGIEIVEVGLRPGEKMYEELLISGNEERTSNSKIFKSNESFIDDDQLDSVISLATEAVKYNNISDIKELMKRHVDGYKY